MEGRICGQLIAWTFNSVDGNQIDVGGNKFRLARNACWILVDAGTKACYGKEQKSENYIVDTFTKISSKISRASQSILTEKEVYTVQVDK